MKSTIINWILVIVSVCLLVLLFTQKSKLDAYLSKEIKSQTDAGTRNSASQLVDSLYNYRTNGKVFQITFLEFGAKGCVACTQMEAVLKETEQTFPDRVNVVFLNILKKENQQLMKYYGIAAIPTQVLLDNKGKEFFRHSGYLSFDDLRNEFIRELNTKQFSMGDN